jgi:hypothetical protein
MGAFGRLHSVSEEESQGVMNSLADNFYKTQKFEGKGGIAEELQKNSSKFLTSLVDKNDEASVRHLQDSGINFEKDRKGKIKDPEKVKEQIRALDVTSGFRAGQAEEVQKAQITTGLGRDMSRMLTETDASVKKALEERMEKIFKATGTTVSNEVRSAPSREESSAARKDLAAGIFEALDELQAAPEDEKQKKSAQIKQQFRDLGLSERGVQKLEDARGGLKTTDARKLAEDFEKGADFIDRESVASTKARDSVHAKRISKDRMLQNLEKATAEFTDTSGDTSEEGRKKTKEAEEKFKKNKKEAGGSLQREAMQQLGITESQFKTKYIGEDKKLLQDKLKNDLEGSTELNSFEKARIEADQTGVAAFRRKGVNFENTRGFKLEDFTSGFAKAADLRMLGDSRGKSPAELMDQFSKNAGGAMAAARSVFGNRSGGELIQKASDLMGVTASDMSSAKGAEEVEDMLRKVKSTARVAGQSIKHMMGIIEATRDMARSNPQLQNMNQGSLTNLAVSSTMRSTSAGAQMNSEDFRNAGGGQGIMAGETRSALAFTQSGMGRLMTVAMGQAKARGKEKEMEKLISEGKFTSASLARGGLTEIANVAGISTGRLTGMANDPSIAQDYLKDKKISDAVSGIGADKSVVSETMTAVSRGLRRKGVKDPNIEKLYAEAKEQGMSDDDFERKYIDPNLTAASRATFQTHKTPFYRALREANMDPDDAAALTKIRDADQAASKETSKRLEGKTGSLASQAISAFMGNEGMDNISEALIGMFATESSSPNKAVMTKAQESAKGLYDSIKDKGKGTDKERLERIDVKDAKGVSDLDRLNDVITAQKTQAEESGDTERAGKLNKLTKKDIQALQGPSGVSSKEEAAARLKELRSRTDLKPEQLQQKATLEAMEKVTGGFKDQESFDAASKRNLSGITGALLLGGQHSLNAEALDKRKTAAFEVVDKRMAQSSDPLTKAAADYYKDKGGAKKLATDLEKGEGLFADKEAAKKFRDSKAGGLVRSTASTFETEEARLNAAGKAPASDSTGSEGILKNILDAISGSSSGSLTTAIGELARAVAKI